MKKLAIVTTHPIQYNAPWFKMLSEKLDIDLKVFYTWSQSEEIVIDRTFGEKIVWDIPLLEGYNYEFIENISKDPGSHHKNGIICPTLNKKIELFNPDVILVFGWYLKSHFDVMKYFKNKKRIWFRGDSTLLDDLGRFKGLIRKVWLTYVYRFVDKALYVGINNKKYYLEFGIREKQLIYAPHSIDNKRFESSTDIDYDLEAKKWREELGLKAEDLVITFVGKFEKKKNPDFLLKVVQEHNIETDQTIKLIFIGSGPLENDMRNLAKQDANIHFIPFQNQSKMPIVYRLGDILCLPSQGPGETWGLVVNEAMACSRGVIVSNKVGCANDLVENDQTGFVFISNNTESLKNILRGLSKGKCENLGKMARRKVEKYNFDAIVEAIGSNL